MKKGLVVLGITLFVGGLVAVFVSISAMVATPCFIDNNCSPNNGDDVRGVGDAAAAGGGRGRQGGGNVGPVGIRREQRG